MLGLKNRSKENPAPKYCSACGKDLASVEAFIKYDSFTGEILKRPQRYCPTLIATHDRWELDESDYDDNPPFWIRRMM